MTYPCPCPICEAETTCEADCPGYSLLLYGSEIILSCHPPCGNALKFSCTQCTWWYRTNNHRAEPQMGIAPAWIREYVWMEE